MRLFSILNYDSLIAYSLCLGVGIWIQYAWRFVSRNSVDYWFISKGVSLAFNPFGTAIIMASEAAGFSVVYIATESIEFFDTHPNLKTGLKILGYTLGHFFGPPMLLSLTASETPTENLTKLYLETDPNGTITGYTMVGSHNANAIDKQKTNSIFGKILAMLLSPFVSNQALTIEQQWSQGARFFQIDFKNAEGTLVTTHEGVVDYQPLADTLQTIVGLAVKNKEIVRIQLGFVSPNKGAIKDADFKELLSSLGILKYFMWNISEYDTPLRDLLSQEKFVFIDINRIYGGSPLKYPVILRRVGFDKLPIMAFYFIKGVFKEILDSLVVEGFETDWNRNIVFPWTTNPSYRAQFSSPPPQFNAETNIFASIEHYGSMIGIRTSFLSQLYFDIFSHVSNFMERYGVKPTTISFDHIGLSSTPLKIVKN